VEQRGRTLRQARRERGEDAVGSLDERDSDVLVRVDAIEPVGNQGARRVVQLGRELDAGRASSDDRDLELFGADWLGLRMPIAMTSVS